MRLQQFLVLSNQKHYQDSTLSPDVIKHPFFSGKGKKTPFNIFTSFPECVEAFRTISTVSSAVEIPAIQPILEKFVIQLYDRTNLKTNVNDARKELFTQKGRSIDHIPPTSAALLQHTQRAALQANIWSHSLESEPPVRCLVSGVGCPATTMDGLPYGHCFLKYLNLVRNSSSVRARQKRDVLEDVNVQKPA